MKTYKKTLTVASDGVDTYCEEDGEVDKMRDREVGRVEGREVDIVEGREVDREVDREVNRAECGADCRDSHTKVDEETK